MITLAGAAVAAWQAGAGGARPGAVPVGSAVVRGVVVTDAADPQPLRRATVRLSGAGSTSRVVGTDDEGRFAFDRLPAGQFTVSATKAGFVPGSHGATRPGRGPGVPVAVADGQTVDVAIRLLPGAVITGVLTDERGNPMPGITVTALNIRASGGPTMPSTYGVSDDRGMYRIFGLAPGDYVVSAVPRLSPASSARGLPSGLSVAAVSDADVQRARAAGAMAGTGVGAGSGPAQPPRSVAYAQVFYPGTTDAAAAAMVRVGVGEERAGTDMTLRIVTLVRLAGTLVDGNGQPVTSAIVLLVPKRDDPSSLVDALVTAGAVTIPRATVSAAGFAFSGVAPGQYTLVARTGSGQRGAVATQAGAPTLWSISDLTVDDRDRMDLALRLAEGLTVTGRVVFERGVAAPVDLTTLNVSLVALSRMPDVASTFRATVQADGAFRVTSLAPGSYLMRAEGPLASSSGTRWVLKSAMVNGRDLADHPVAALADGTELPGVVVTLTDRGSGIAGRLIDTAGRPVTRYSVVIVTRDRSLWLPNARRIRSVRPATDGSFAASALPAGEYAIAAVEDVEDADLSNVAFLSQVLESGVSLTVAEGQLVTQDLRIGR